MYQSGKTHTSCVRVRGTFCRRASLVLLVEAYGRSNRVQRTTAALASLRMKAQLLGAGQEIYRRDAPGAVQLIMTAVIGIHSLSGRSGGIRGSWALRGPQKYLCSPGLAPHNMSTSKLEFARRRARVLTRCWFGPGGWDSPRTENADESPQRSRKVPGPET